MSSNQELITFVNNEGLALCTDLKLKSQMKKEKQDSKKELGKFCSYYGYDTIVAHSKRKNKIKGKKPYTESKFQKKFVKSTPNKSKSSNKTTFKKENTNML